MARMTLASIFGALNPFAAPALSIPPDLAPQAAQPTQLAIHPPVNPETAGKKPELGEKQQYGYINSAGINRPCFSGLSLYDPPTARQCVDAMDIGNFQAAGAMMEEMTRDDAVMHGLRTRTARLVGLRQRFEPSRRRGGKRAARLWAKFQKIMFPQGIWRDIMKFLYFFGFCICEIVWIKVRNEEKDGPPYWYIPQLKPWHPFFLIWQQNPMLYEDSAHSEFGGDQANGYWSVMTQNEATIPLTGEDAPGRGRWLMFTAGGLRPWYQGLLRAMWMPWLRRVYTRRDHARFEEKHGLPITAIYFPTYMGSESKDWLTFQNSVQNFGSNGIMMCPRDKDKPEGGVDVEYKAPPNDAVKSFVASKTEEDNDIYTLWLGQSLSTAAGENGGSHAAAKEATKKEDLIARDDSLCVSDAQIDWFEDEEGGTRWRMVPSDGPIREQMGRWWAWYNFGDPNLAPHQMFDATPDSERKAAEELRKLRAEKDAAIATAYNNFFAAPLKNGAEPAPIDAKAWLAQAGYPIIGASDEEGEDEAPGLMRALRSLAGTKYAGLDFRPTEAVRKTASRAAKAETLNMRAKRRALALGKRQPWTPEVVTVAAAWFAKHDATSPDYATWGGDAGKSQALALFAKMKEAQPKTTALLSEVVAEIMETRWTNEAIARNQASQSA